MSRLFVFALLSSILVFPKLSAQQEGIQFQSLSLKDALKEAKKSNKSLFIVCYKEKNNKFSFEDIFKRKEVGDFYNNHFVSIKIKIDDAPDFGKKFNIRMGDQTYIFLNDKGDLINVGYGYQSLNGFLINLGKVAIDPDKNYATQLSRLKSGDNSYDIINFGLNRNSFIRNDMSENCNKENEELLDRYFNDKSVDERFSRNSWELISRYAHMESKYGFFLISNEDKYGELFDPNRVSRTIEGKIDKFISSGYKCLGLNFNEAVNYLNRTNPYLYKKVIYTDLRVKTINKLKKDLYNLNQWENLFEITRKCIALDTAIKREKQFLTLFANNVFDLIGNDKLPEIYSLLSSSKDSMALFMVQNLKFCEIESKLEGTNSLNQQDIDFINQNLKEILQNCKVNELRVGRLAQKLFEHPKRDNFLMSTKSLLACSLTDFRFYRSYITYASICAQLGEFEEAVKIMETEIESLKHHNFYHLSCEKVLMKFKNKEKVY
jgi:hypothetical protein